MRRAIADLLSVAMQADDNQSVIVFAPDWTVLAEGRLGDAKRTLLLHSAREACRARIAGMPRGKGEIRVGRRRT